MASRLENSARNVLVALGGQAFSIILAFVTRGIFARQLSLEYMGLENLFSNVLTILSLADLGVASAIIFALYRPLAEENHEQVRAIMRLFRNVYVIIGLVIIAAGLALTPYIDVLIKDTPDIPYLKLYFFMFVANTGISYFFSYKGCLIAADQKKYIVSLNQYAFQIVMCIAQIAVLFVTHNYFLFLCCMVGSTLLQNISISIIANRMYPYILKGKGKPKVDPETIDQIKKNTFAMVLHRVAGVANTPASSLILSSFVGIQAIALYGNYMLVVNSMTRVVDQIFDAVVAPLGNLGVTESGERQYQVFKTCFFVNAFIAAFISIPMLCLFNPVITQIWLGPDYAFPEIVVVLIVLLFYLKEMRCAALSFTSAYGLYWYTRWKAVVETVVMLSLSLLLVLKFEVAGVVFAGIISTTCVSSIYEGYMLFKHGFKKSSKPYFARFYLYVGFTAILALVAWFGCAAVPDSLGMAGILVKLVVSVAVPVLGFWAVFRKTQEFAELKSMMMRIFAKLPVLKRFAK